MSRLWINTKVLSRSALLAVTLGAGGLAATVSAAAAAATAKDVVTTYADIAKATYEDSLMTAKALRQALSALVAAPTEANLTAAKTAWLAARKPYQQSEAYRFGNPAVDEWEGKVNAWPLDEGLIDYVSAEYGTENEENPLYAANIIANAKLKIDGKDVDATTIDKALLSGTLQEAGGVEANVATGYHAIEFLLWGQDKNGTGQGAGARPASDYDTSNCTNGHCDRRAQYLLAAADLLVDDLGDAVKMWSEGGAARDNLVKGDDKAGLTAIMTGLGSLSYGELAGERMKLGLLVHDPEEEHDCFSDNTHNSHLYDAIGIRNVYLGSYQRIDGSTVSGPSVSDLVKAKDAAADAAVREKLDATVAAMQAMAKRADEVEKYDQMIGEGNAEGNATVQAAIDALVNQTRAIERAVAVLDLKAIEFEGSDSLDAPDKVGK